MMHDFNEYKQAGQEKIQRMTEEADEWRRAQTVPITLQPKTGANGWLRPILASLINLLTQ